MSNIHYNYFESVEVLSNLVQSVCTIDGDKVVAITDDSKLQNEVIYTLQFNASTSDNPEIKNACIKWINAIADAMQIRSSSNTKFYAKKAEGEHQFFTVPAINARMVAFHTVRSAVRAGDALGVPHIIFELAISEGGYTGQEKDEYTALIRAAYISLGVKDRDIQIQADHYQLNPKKYESDSEAELKRVKSAIVKAIENGVYNIDLDCSKFETADPDKSDRENQGVNAKLTAQLLAFIRNYEKENKLPVEISVGGEVGEVGGENTRYPQVNAYLQMLKENLEALDSADVRGLDKVSINVGSAHGGVLGPDGKPLETVPLDFQAHHDMYMKAEDPLKPNKHVLSVQHGASTLPKHYFPLFPAMHVAEVHLATGFQNVTWEVLEKEDNALYGKMKEAVMEKFADNISKHETEAIGFMKERKRVTEFFKKDLLLSDAIDEIEKALEQEFVTLFTSLYNVLLPKAGTVIQGDRSD